MHILPYAAYDWLNFVVGHSEIETDSGGNDDMYDYDFLGGDAAIDRKSVAISREFPRRRARFRRQAEDYSARGDYQYPDDDVSMTSSATSRTPSTERQRNNSSDASSVRKMSLPTDPEVRT